MKKWIFLSVLIVLLAAGGVGFYILSQPPKDTLSEEFKQEAVTKLLGRKAQLEADTIPQGNTVYEGKHIKFEYPAKALIYTFREGASSSAVLEDFSFDIKSPKTVFNMRVEKAGGSLEEYPAVRLRKMRDYEYKQSAAKAGGVMGLTFYKSGREAEKSGFFVNAGKMYSISVTGINESEVEKIFDEITSSVSFL